MMGVCQQTDILWDTMTGEEHLLFFGRIRGLSGKVLQSKVNNMLKKVNLFEARHVVSKNYSGGMKRRLSVAIALLNSPPLIYLDEPSTGLDPASRQNLWEMINEAKKSSCIVLTTHSMEEADAICDRIIIMADGEMKCIGVSAELKNRFGEGFKLSVQIAKGFPEEPVDTFIKKLAPGALLVNKLSGTRSYQLPQGAVTLDRVFAQVEKHKEKLHITDWAITNTTLEEVFLRISKDRHSEEEPMKSSKRKAKKYTFSDDFSEEMDTELVILKE